MVKMPNGMAKAKGASAPAGPSKVNASSGSVKTSKFKKRRVVKVKREKKTASAAAAADEVSSVGARTAGADDPALVSSGQPADITKASPVAQAPKPATDGEGSVPTPVPANAEASASAAKKNPADTDAATSSKGKGVSANTSGGDRKMKNSKQSAKERAMDSKGKEMEDDEGRKGKDYKAVAKKGGKGEKKGAGFIFMCNQQTKQECYQSRLFGLPSGKLGMVKKIKPGAKLFLYDFDLKLLYGVYKAASNGGLNLVQEAFNGKFPAQVNFKIDRDCLPLPESSFKHAVKENYSSRSKFHPELSLKQVQRLIALFKPADVPRSVPKNRLDERRRTANVPRSVPKNRLDERRRNGERRQPYHFEERRRSLSIEEVRQTRFDERRHPAVIHVPVEDTYRAPRFAPLPVESCLGRSLTNVQDEHHTYYEPVHLAPEPRRIPLAIDSHHAPLVLERQHLLSVPEPQHVPSAYYRTLAPSDDSYYQPVADLGPQRFADRTMAQRTARDSIITRDHRTMPVELSAHQERMEELYGTGRTREAHVEERYGPRGLGVRADRLGISSRADRLEELEQFDTRAVDFPRHSTYTMSANETLPAYAEPSQRYYPARAGASGLPVRSLYSFSDGPVYR